MPGVSCKGAVNVLAVVGGEVAAEKDGANLPRYPSADSVCSAGREPVVRRGIPLVATWRISPFEATAAVSPMAQSVRDALAHTP